MLTKTELRRLRQGLPKGWKENIASVTRKSSSYVHKVLFGLENKFNEEIIVAAKELKQANENALEAKRQQLKKGI